ncbi:helix-turn-helix domain-containing protein [Vibrio cholerae]|uniref:helix-turn-helix domain-containing protein n=1 Tax=Vibrio TaxID=662 RepID=UPI0004E3BB87|nr:MULTISPECIES: helix-turn-helix domain-containing protein [Vibrio]KFD81870.1 helix-turn-helix domain protein [Vibrio paracholerae]QAV06888.1 Xylose activator XylR (AraC family) [Vibrio cholerae]TXX92286.1 helix-turn-helix domain-containing protein [Vibrio cholerae]GHW99029.1 XylR family transcriptional regulator [Vibrio cholerae]GHZ47299.1 XylR family transcriptional regulator [Vibrio cholerae]
MKRILVLLDLMVHYDREIFRGIKSALGCQSLKYTLCVHSVCDVKSYQDQLFELVIADGDKLNSKIELSNIAKSGVVYSSHLLPLTNESLSLLIVCNQQFAKMAIGKFIQLGLDRVGFYSSDFDSKFAWSIEREKYFMQTAVSMGLEVVTVNNRQLDVLDGRLGVLCSSDRSARSLIQNLVAKKVQVPNQVCVIGIDNDVVENDVSPVSITSIDINPYEIGKQALSIAMSSNKSRQYFYISDLMEVRESCTGDSPSDGIVAKALFFIHNNFHNSIKVPDVARYCAVSRKTLDSRFLQSMNITVHQYIHEKRLSKCFRLLKETTDSMESVALQCGYPNQSYLYQVFKKEMKCTPLEYRNR